MFLLLWLILNLICISESARILGIFPNTGYSQYILGSTLMKELAARGHEVTMVSSYSQRVPVANYKEIATNLSENETLYELESLNVFGNIMSLYNNWYITEHTLKNNQVQELLHSNISFDLVICELFANEAHMGFAHRFQAPLILFCSVGAIEWANHLVGNPAPFSHVPVSFSGYSDGMTFWERYRNAIIGLFDIIYKHLYVFPKQNEILKRYFPNAPDLKNLMYNVSLILLNSHVATNVPMAHVPNMIEVGGFHVSPKKLPEELQEFLDNAHNGAVFFSMGSNLKSSDLSTERCDAILQAFSKLKQRVLWKFEDQDLPRKPGNVKIGKWLPQQDILAHPNIRAFITHGGLLSITEAVHHGVPIIAIPVFGDQKMNTETAVANGFALKIPFQELSEEKLTWALNEILTNTSYRKTAQRRSEILKDRPLNPLDTAMFWIEYVLRQRGANHLRSSSLNLNWYQYFLIDIFIFTIIITVAVFIICKALFCTILTYTKIKNKKKTQ